MSGWSRYALVGATLVGGGAAAVWPLLEPPGRRGVLLAAGVAYPLQLASLALRRRFRASTRGFLGTLAGGALLRMAAVLAVGAWMAVAGSPAPAETLLGLVGFLVALLLLEPLFLDDRDLDDRRADERRPDGDGRTDTDSGIG